jgi:ubiquinone/menaquinone biosynthesis C-methylase UbiE
MELAKRFKHVIGMDPSPAQISAAPQLDNVEFREGPAEATGLPSSSADLITIAEALHW